jgi:hypothetical protein
MNPRTLTLLALRVLSIYLASKAFTFIASMASSLMLPHPIPFTDPVNLALAGVWSGIPLLVALALWVFAPFLARRVTSDVDEAPLSLPEPRVLASTTFLVAGVLILISALPDVVLQYLRFEHPHPSPHAWISVSGFHLLASLLRCVLGTALLIGAQTITRFVFWLRYSGSSGQTS